MVLVPAKTTKRKTTVAQSSPAKKTKVTPAKKGAAAKTKAGAKRGSPNKNNAEDEENEEVEEQTEEVEEEGSGNEEEVKEEGDEGDENEEGDEEGNEEGDEQENAGETTAEGEGETKTEPAPSPIKKGTGPSKLEAYVFQNLNPHTSIADVHRVLRANSIDTGLVNASIVVEFKPNVPKNFLESAAKITFGGENEKFTVGKYKPLEISEYIDNIPPPSVNFKQWLKISVLDLDEGTTKEEVKEIVENVVGEEVKVETGNATSMVITFQSEKSFGKLLVHDDLKVKDKAVRLKIPFVTNITRSNNRRSDFSPRKNGVSGSPIRGGRGGNVGGGFGGGRGGGGFFGGPKRGGRGAARMGGGYGGYGGYMRPF